jgi:Domain of unknown function (DUF4124)
MLRNLTISTLLCVGAVSVAYADVFRWVDDHGGVHYSDQWVPGSEVIKSSAKTHPQGSETASHTSVAPKLSSSTTGQATPDTAAKAVKQDLAKVREQQCKDAKDRYDKAIQARRIYKVGPSNGNSKDPDHAEDRQYLSDEEADAYRVKARQDVQDYCGASAIKPSGE